MGLPHRPGGCVSLWEVPVQYLYDENSKQLCSTEKLRAFAKAAHTLTSTRDKIKTPSPPTCLQVSPGYQELAQGTVVSALCLFAVTVEASSPALSRRDSWEHGHGSAGAQGRGRTAEQGPAPSRAGAVHRALALSTACPSPAPPSTRNDHCVPSPDPARRGRGTPRDPSPSGCARSRTPEPGKGTAGPTCPQCSLLTPGDRTESHTVGAGPPEPNTTLR